MTQTHARGQRSQVRSRSAGQEPTPQKATTVQDASPLYGKHAGPPKAHPHDPRKLESASMPRGLMFRPNDQYHKQRHIADSNGCCAASSLEPLNSSQTPTTASSEGVRQSLGSKSTLKAGLKKGSPLKNLNNHNTYHHHITNPGVEKVVAFTSRHDNQGDHRSTSYVMASAGGSPSLGPYQNRGSPRRQVPYRPHPNWRVYAFIDVSIHDFPPHVTTADIYKNFVQHGEIAFITLKNAPGGAWNNSAEIRFKPPPRVAFWESNPRHRFKDGNGSTFDVTVKLSHHQRENFSIESPVQKGVFYNEETELHADSINFGVLTDPRSMMIMRTRQSMRHSKVKLLLNLKRKEIEIRFPSSAGVSDSLYEKYPWFRPEFRFCVSMDQDLSIAQIHEVDDKVSFVLRLENPPPYSKKLHEEVLGSHVAEARRWVENDVWLRQTMITGPHHENKDATTPISLARSEGAINIGRWTAFRITFDQKGRDLEQFRIMTKALGDFNIKVATVDDFKYVAPVPSVWEFLDRHLQPQRAVTGRTAEDLSLLEVSAPPTLPFQVRYLLDVCISTGRLNEYVVREDFVQALVSVGEFKACNKLKLILDMPPNRELVEPMSIFDDRKFRPVLRKIAKVPDNCALIYSATVTATTVVFHAPSVEITNRIIRQYKQHADRFLRVRFEDDKYRGNSRIYAMTTNKMDAIFRRVRRTLTSGITIGDRKYEFLAWGNSQLREHGAYFFADLPNVLTASQIRAIMGQFDHEKIIAKRAARMGQCFSTTRPVKLRIPRVTRTSLIDDVERNGYTFTDGVGQISPLLADLINHQLKLDDQTPSLFQFRLGGCKGVLAISDLKGIDIRLRKSQFKFASDSNDLEVIRCSRFEAAHLNRQLISVLSALGVPNSVFMGMQEKEMKELNEAMENDAIAEEKLRKSVDANQSTLGLADMINCGFRAGNEPFVTSLLHLWRAWSLKYLREKAKLHIENGATLLGCVDETATLRGHYSNNQPAPEANYQERYAKLPQIFVQVETAKSKELRAKQKRDGQTPNLPVYQVKEGICLIARNPSLHEGDIRVVRAVNVPALAHLRDVLVLPQTGDRDLSNMCSGGDLDGDDYIVIWTEDLQSGKFDLLPKTWNAKPMDYTPSPPLRAIGDITQNDIIQFFEQYMRNDFLGKIAHAHLGWADNSDEGIESDQCHQLANLHSQAVDYPKTGQPARLPRALERFEWPHFMEKKGGKPYHSHKILGKLYDKVERVKFVPNYRGRFNAGILNALEPSKAVCEQIEELKKDYDMSVRRIMAQHEIKTEFEVWSTFVLDHSKASRDFKFHEEIGILSSSLKEQFEEAIVEAAGGRTPEHLQPYAVAAYRLVQQQVSEAFKEAEKGDKEEPPGQMPLISFPWILQNTLGKLAMAATQPATYEEDALGARNTNFGEPQDTENRCRKTPSMPSSLQGELFADPHQPGTQTLDDGSKDATVESSEHRLPEPMSDFSKTELGRQHSPRPSYADLLRDPASRSSSTKGLLSNGESSSNIGQKVNSLLDNDKDKYLSISRRSSNEKIMAQPQVTSQQWEEIDQIIGSPPTTSSSDFDTFVHVSKESSEPLSRALSMASSNDEINSDRQRYKTESTSNLQRKGSSPRIAELEGLDFGPQSYIDEDGIYRSKYRRSSAQSGSSGSRRGSRQVSGEGRSAAAIAASPEVGGPGLGIFGMPSLPERTLAVVSESPSRPAEVTHRRAMSTLSAKAAFRKEIDSDDEGEVLVYGDPAGMVFRA